MAKCKHEGCKKEARFKSDFCWEHIQDMIDRIKKGELIISDSSGEYSENIPTPGFEWFSIIMLLGLALIQIRRRR